MTPAEIQNELTLLRAQAAQISVKNATLAAENRRLRRLTANGRVGRLPTRTAADARQVCVWRWAGFSVGRQQALSYGMSRRRWHWAVALLERARVVKPDARYLDDAFDVEDLAAGGGAARERIGCGSGIHGKRPDARGRRAGRNPKTAARGAN